MESLFYRLFIRLFLLRPPSKNIHEFLVSVLINARFAFPVSKLREVLIYVIYFDSLQICEEIMINNSGSNIRQG